MPEKLTPIIPTHSILVDKAIRSSPDGKLVTIRRTDILAWEEQTRRYYRNVSKGKSDDFANINGFLLLFYHNSIPKGIEPRYFRFLLACFHHSKRDYLLTEGIRRLDAKNTLKSELIASPLIRPYFPTWSTKSFSSTWTRFVKKNYLQYVPDYLPVHQVRRKFIKTAKYYRLTAEGEMIIRTYEANVVRQYEETVTVLRAKAYLLHTFKELPVDLRKLTKGKRIKHKNKVENLSNID